MKRLLVKFASEVWSTGSALSRTAFRLGLKSSVRLPVRVISVGNLQVGGSGKTPLVAEIAREAHERGLQVCILSRGYRGKWEFSGGIIEPGKPVDALDSGDECALLHELAPHAVIGVGADRLARFRKIAEGGRELDLVILDDGFQHGRIRKDVEIVAVTSYFPSEVIHRDRVGALVHADLVVWTKGDRLPDLGESSAALVQTRFVLPAVAGKPRVWLVSGVADPVAVRESARLAGYEIVKAVQLADHVRYTRAEVEAHLAAAAAAGARIALTGKDWVKWRSLGVEESKVVVLEPTLQFISGHESWMKVLWGSK